MERHYEDFFDYGELDGKIVHVNTVENGKNCKCVCPACKSDLIAYNRVGNKIRSHFKHASKKKCMYYMETLVHKIAKQILDNMKSIKLPYIYPILSTKPTNHLRESEFFDIRTRSSELTFDEVFLEVGEDGFRPDLKCIKNGRILYIEIAVTHFVDDVKSERVRAKGDSMLEIDLSKMDRADIYSQVEAAFTKGIFPFKWIVNKSFDLKKKKAEYYSSKLKEFAMKNIKQRKVYAGKKIYDCPLSRDRSEYTSVQRDCAFCEWCLGDSREDREIEYQKQIRVFRNSPIEVYCIGHISDEFEYQVEQCNEKLL